MPESGLQSPYDILIIGGGVNGAGIARDAAGRNLKVLLCEMNDLGSGTSSASTKLIHGGLRYLEYYEFRLVRESLGERETLLRAAPHIIWPMRFVLPHHRGLRPRWLLRLGLFLYDHLGKRKILPGAESLKLREDERGEALKEEFTHGFAYSDCWVEDSRLVVLNARDAADLGADIRTRTRCTSLEVEDGLWRATLEDPDGHLETVQARAVVNAAGPWVDEVMGQIHRNDLQKDAPLRLVKGSHAIVEKLYDGEHAYIFQNTDGRILFAIPYEGRFTLLGTTDVAFDGDPAEVNASDEEIGYICRSVSDYFRTPVTPGQVVHRYSGVRPLYDESVRKGGGAKNASAVTRDYVFDLQAEEGLPPLLSIYGGKITTFRKLAEHALKELQPHLGFQGRPWTASAPLPGGDIADADFTAFLDGLSKRYAWVPADVLRRLARAYGSDVPGILGSAHSMEELGENFGAGLTEAELIYLKDREWARTAEDALWRRSKLGLHMNQNQIESVVIWFEKHRK